MRFNLSFLILPFISFFVTCSCAFVGPTCMKIKDSLADKPDIIFKEFYNEICKKGCQPTIQDFDKFAKHDLFEPIIKIVTKDMGITQHQHSLLALANDLVNVVKKDCAQHLKGKHLCQDPATLDNFGKCLKGNLMPVVMSKVGQLMPLVAEPLCQKEYAYLQSDKLWEGTIPRYIKKYARTCKKNWTMMFMRATHSREISSLLWRNHVRDKCVYKGVFAP